MKKILLIGTVAFVLLLTGCSQKKQPEVVEVDEVEEVIVTDGDNFVDMDAYAKQLESELAAVYFDFDKYNIKNSMVSTVDTDAGVLKGAENLQDYTVKLEGNCDEWGSDEYNYALGLKRAKSLKGALDSRGVNVSDMVLISYGKSNPVCTEHTKSCWAKNRRVDFDVIPNK